MPELTAEELPGIREAFHIKINKQDLTPEQHKLIVKALLGLDGSTSDFLGMSSAVSNRLKEIGLDISSLADTFAPELISLLTTQEEIARLPTAEDGPTRYFDFHEAESLRGDLSCEASVDTYILRRRRCGVLEALVKLAKAVERPAATAKTLEKVRDCQKKLLLAEGKVAKEEERMATREAGRKKAADEKQAKVEKNEQKEKARREAEEKRREEEKKKEEKKEEKRREEERKKEEKEEKRKEEEKKKEEKRLLEEKKKEERRLADEQKKEEKRLEEQRKAEKKAEEEAIKEKNQINLTRFFNPLPKTETEQNETGEAMAEENIPERVSVWKKGLGSIKKFSEWGDERRREFEELLNAKNISESNGMSLEHSYNISIDILRTELAEQLHHLREGQAILTKKTEDSVNHQRRRVMVKYEDYLSDCYEYRGELSSKERCVQAAKRQGYCSPAVCQR